MYHDTHYFGILKVLYIAHQLGLEDGGRVGVARDLLVQHGLREERLVDLVVAHAAVADHVDDAVLAVLHAHDRQTRKTREQKKKTKKKKN